MAPMREPVTIQLRDANDDGELAALSHLVSILDAFPENIKRRMLNYLCERFPEERIALDKE